MACLVFCCLKYVMGWNTRLPPFVDIILSTCVYDVLMLTVHSCMVRKVSTHGFIAVQDTSTLKLPGFGQALATRISCVVCLLIGVSSPHNLMRAAVVQHPHHICMICPETSSWSLMQFLCTNVMMEHRLRCSVISMESGQLQKYI